MRMINQSKVDKGIMLKMESMHLIKDTLIHNYNPSIISEIVEIFLKKKSSKDVNYFLNNSAKTKQDVLNEVDRYINWPGQALAYKIGQLKILELKADAELAFGDSFNIKDFHHEILKRGALPLDTLEKYINEWIADGTN